MSFRNTAQNWTLETCRFLHSVYQHFRSDNGTLVSAALSFYAVLSLLPGLLVGVSALGYLLGSARAFDSVIRFIQDYAPGPVTGLVHDTLSTLVNTRRAAGVIGAAGLLWTSLSIFTSMEHALCVAWKVRQRPFWKARLLSLGFMIFSGVCLLLSLGFSALTLRIQGWQERLFGVALPQVPWFWKLLALTTPILLSIVVYGAIYLILPNTRVRRRSALAGGLFAGVLWQIALHVFRSYLTSSVAKYDVIYGSLAGAVILVLWIYYTMLVFMMGAEVACETDRRLKKRKQANALRC